MQYVITLKTGEQHTTKSTDSIKNFLLKETDNGKVEHENVVKSIISVDNDGKVKEWTITIFNEFSFQMQAKDLNPKGEQESYESPIEECNNTLSSTYAGFIKNLYKLVKPSYTQPSLYSINPEFFKMHGKLEFKNEYMKRSIVVKVEDSKIKSVEEIFN